MTLWDDTAADLDQAWFDPEGLAQTVTYRERDGAPRDILALIAYGEEQGRQVPLGGSSSGVYFVDTLEAVVKAADVPQPQALDELTAGGQLWQVRRALAGNGLAWRLTCTKEVRRGALS